MKKRKGVCLIATSIYVVCSGIWYAYTQIILLHRRWEADESRIGIANIKTYENVGDRTF
jgi:hypothetical protein